MSDEDEYVPYATINEPLTYTRMKGRTTKETGATRQFHADCPCCGYRFPVDHTDAEQSMEDRKEQTFRRKTLDKAQHYFTETWGWKTHEREHQYGSVGGKPIYGDNKSKGIRSDSVDIVIQTGVGFALRSNYRKAMRDGYKVWFAVLWHAVPTMGEMFFACQLKDLFTVLRAIADDSPEFAFRLRQAADLSLKRDGSAARGGRNDEVASKGWEGGGEPLDPGPTVRV